MEQLQIQLLVTALPAVVAGALIVALTGVGIRLWRSAMRHLAERVLRQGESMPRERQLKIQTLAAVSQTSGTIVLGAVGGLMALARFVDVTPLLAGAGVVGLAVGLGAQSLIRDVISGFFILLEDHFGVGDVIKVNEQYAGYVEHLDLRRTVLRNQEGWVYTIPNGEIRVVANMTRGWSRAVVDVAVAYREDTDRVVEALRAAGDELLAQPDMAAVLLEQPEILGVEMLGESQVTIRVLLKTQPMRQWEVGRRYRALVKKAFEREEIEVPSRHAVVLINADSRGREGHGTGVPAGASAASAYARVTQLFGRGPRPSN